jgi:hypothetical protein
LELRPDHLAAALACGCAISPATEDQVRRFAAQRRIFRVHGEPVVAVRGGFFETWATLAARIEHHRSSAPDPGAQAGAAVAPEPAAQNDTGLSPGPAQPDAEAKRAHRDDAAVTQRGPQTMRAPRSKSAPADAGAAHTGGTGAGPSEAEERLSEGAAAQRREPKARALWRGRRTGWPRTPRWMIAGKMRRGRLK